MEEILAHSYYRYSVYQERPGVYALVAYCAHYTVFRHRLFGFFFRGRAEVASSLPSAVCCLLTAAELL